MATIFNLILLSLSVCLVAARPGVRDMTEMMCTMSVSGCMGDIATADYTSPAGIARICSSMHAPFDSCVDNLPEHCAPYMEQFNLGEMRSGLDQLCRKDGCTVSDMISCMAIIEQSGNSAAAICSVKEQYLDCDSGLPDACRSDSNYNQNMAPLRTMLESMNC
ncbi:uncharacterized protein LOC117321571 [Pecten maximus]|uniref:uncharacterized protein LOC117321571 n=1 Tax=Pecten maximus TaxID=6579 RepID=UPI0014586615|nr:uncharacterized protein LOC117321571 [Pecten maximus]